ncbi:glycosyltransferase family 2 protein [Mangrovibacterium lignilyticum]|uniref:glycosyltransferase family 2 protein n=1 Tax=Mangrovibacterium lignilyticum TaxID=2668052 RepID=UPI0013D4D3A2|nr:glycosyltransferase family 2 protein [Mangrovibacterium lignilyticum]
MTTVSIIVPIYNSSQYVPKCIKSIINQTYTDFELILINDGSTDQSGEICDEIAKRDNRIRVIHTLNGGVSTARNKGIENATGEYLCFIDSDDWIEPDFLESFFYKGDTDYCDIFVIQDFLKEVNGQVNPNCNFPNNTFPKSLYSSLFTGTRLFRFGHPFAKLYNNNIIQEHKLRFDENIHFSEDLVFMLEYILHINTIRTTSTAKYHYVINNTTSLANSYNSFESEFQCFNKTKNLLSKIENTVTVNAETKQYFEYTLGHFLLRSVQSIYRRKTKKKYAERIEILSTIMTEDNAKFLSTYAHKNSQWIYIIPTYLFKKKKILSFDIFSNLTFRARYSLATIWNMLK